MNVFYPTHTFGLKEIPTFKYNDTVVETQTVYFINTHVFSIDSEGTLYQSPRFLDGSFNTLIWEETNYEELWGDEFDGACLAHDCLIEQAQKEGWYYTQAK